MCISYISISIGWRLISIPFRANSYNFFPPTFFAEYMGGICVFFPKKVEIIFSILPFVSGDRRGGSRFIFPVSSYVSLISPSFSVASYVLSNALNWSNCFVAFRPMPTIRRPVAKGSNVPEWPIFLIPVFFRKCPTTSWLVQSFGLSMRRNPDDCRVIVCMCWPKCCGCTMLKLSRGVWRFPWSRNGESRRLLGESLQRMSWVSSRRSVSYAVRCEVSLALLRLSSETGLPAFRITTGPMRAGNLLYSDRFSLFFCLQK